MANEQTLQNLDKIIEELRSINEDKLLRVNLGEESLKDELDPFLAELNSKIDFAKSYASKIHNNYVNQFIKSINAIKDQLNAQAERNNQEYIANKQGVLNACKEQLEQLRVDWAHFVAAAIEERGFLHDEGILYWYAQR